MKRLDETVDLFLSEKSKSTRKSYYYVMRDFMDYAGAGRPLAKVTNWDVREYAVTIKKRESVKSPATYNKYVKTVRIFFNWCVKAGLLAESPAAGVPLMRQARHVDRDKAMPDTALAQLLDYTKWHIRADALVRFLSDTGCRIGGAAGLRVRDLNMEDNTAQVIEKGAVDSRTVFFGEQCARAVDRWILRRQFGEGDYVFSRKGKRMTNASLGQFFRRQTKRAGVGSWGPHSLRHRKGYQLSDARISPTVGATVLGHRNVETTLKHYYPGDLERAQKAALELSQDNAPSEKPSVYKFKDGTDS